jgi:hypothetical protein
MLESLKDHIIFRAIEAAEKERRAWCIHEGPVHDPRGRPSYWIAEDSYRYVDLGLGVRAMSNRPVGRAEFNELAKAEFFVNYSIFRAVCRAILKPWSKV